MRIFNVLLLFFNLFLMPYLPAKERSLPKPPKILPSESIEGKPFVQGILHNQLGNQMFEIAATISVALDNGAIPIFPDLVTNTSNGIPLNYQYVFWRLNTSKPKQELNHTHHDHGLPYQPILYQPNMGLCGLFQSEKHFIHHKDEILKAFSPHESIVSYLYKKYNWLQTNPKTVAVHVRAYWPIYPGGNPEGKGVLPFLGLEYFKKAILTFPKDHLFVIFSDNIKWCKKNFRSIPREFIFIEKQDYYLDFFMMGLCQHNIISNSSFSWWAAYMNKNPSKIVIAPKGWFTPESKLDASDIIPAGWNIL